MNLVEQTARASYGKLLAILTKATSGDVGLAEDCLAEAFARALETWTEQSVPSNPEAWLVRTAKNRLIDQKRREQTQVEKSRELLETLAVTDEETPVPDRRLEMMFVCTHPAIDPAVRTPLILQTVMGFGIEQIASRFLVSPDSIEKRLTRAKRKIKDAAIPFEVPDPELRSERLEDVLQSIYAVYGQSWDDQNRDLEEESLFLAELVTRLMPGEPEPLGLLSLLLFCHPRAKARRFGGVYVPFSEQDTQSWDQALIAQAEEHLRQAFSSRSPGRFQYEAALQSALVAQKVWGAEVQDDVCRIYEEIIRLSNTVGARVAYASALVEFGELEKALSIVADLDPDQIKSYQPYWALRAELAFRQKQTASAIELYDRAIGLTEDSAIKDFLLKKKSRAQGQSQ